MKALCFDIATRIFVVVIFLLFPVVALLGAPWALYNSIGSWGHTTWKTWLDDWVIYSPSSLKNTAKHMIKPLQFARHP